MKLSSKVVQYFKWVFIVFVSILLIHESTSLLGDTNITILKHSFHEITILEWFILVVLGMACFSPLVIYDFLLKRRLALDVSGFKTAKYGWISNSISNFVGFGGIAGITLRTYFYGRYFQDKKRMLKEASKIIALNLMGLSLLSGVFLFHQLWIGKTFVFTIPSLAVFFMSLYFPTVLGFILYKLWKLKDQNEFKYLAKIITVSITEWFFVSILIYFIGVVIGAEFNFLSYGPLFITASCMAIISMIPGGLGSFDLTLIVGLGSLGVTKEQALLLLLIYRIIYYMVPLFIGLYLLFKEYWVKFNEGWMGVPIAVRNFLAHKFLIVLILVSGIVLLVSAAVPTALERIKYMNDLLSLPLMTVTHQLSIAFGFCLVVFARLLCYKVKHVYYLSLLLLVLGSIFTFSKGFDYEEGIFVAVVAWLLWMTRRTFTKEAFVITKWKVFLDSFMLFVFSGLYLLIGFQESSVIVNTLPAEIRSYFTITEAKVWNNAILGLLIAVLILLIVYVWNGRPKFPYVTFQDQEQKIHKHIEEWGGTALTHLIYLYDKKFYFSTSGDVMFIFQFKNDRLVVLGQPIGDKSKFSTAVEELLLVSRNYGWEVVFYQVQQDFLSILHEKGYDFFKLGEEGFVDLETFNLSGRRGKSLRAVKNKLEKEGYRVEVIHPPFTKDILQQLEAISDEWLDDEKEKGFSMGYYSESYIQSAPIILVRDSNAYMVAFSTFMPMYDGDKSLSVDLMRFKKQTMNGIMDYLFIELIEYGKSNGYHWFNIGMAPLSNVGQSRFSFISEKLAAQIYLHGQDLYSFKGLRQYKEKFADVWQPRFMASRKKSSLPLTMIQLTTLISKGDTPVQMISPVWERDDLEIKLNIKNYFNNLFY